MANTLKLGLVGASATGGSWGSVAHIPALREIEEIDLVALCTSRPESAAAAGKAFGVERAYHDIDELVAQSDIDIIATVVNIPSHYDIVMTALEAGKHVYCEWPLGVTSRETEKMASFARTKDVVTGIGLQGRYDPSLTYIKELCDEGWLGDIYSIHMTYHRKANNEYPSLNEYEHEVHRGATLMKIAGGHTLDYIEYCFGSLTEISAKVATRIQQLRMADTGEMIDAQVSDNVLINGILASGALLSCQLSTVPFHFVGWNMTVSGSKGTIIATTQGLPQITPVKLVGAQGDNPMVEMQVPERLRFVPASVPMGPPQNVGHAYIRMAQAIQAGTSFSPNFEDALRMHKLLDTVQKSSDEGRTVKVI